MFAFHFYKSTSTFQPQLKMYQKYLKQFKDAFIAFTSALSLLDKGKQSDPKSKHLKKIEI